MISPTDLFNKYNGQTVGTNDGDYGECVGWYNVGLRDQTGVLYPIQGAYGACEILTANNTRPDLMTQIWNDPNDLNQIPTPGDWVIWGGNLPGSGGYGHVAMFLDHPNSTLVTVDQNWGGRTVHQVTHDWGYVIGWIHLIPTISPSSSISSSKSPSASKSASKSPSVSVSASLSPSISVSASESPSPSPSPEPTTKWWVVLIKWLISIFKKG